MKKILTILACTAVTIFALSCKNNRRGTVKAEAYTKNFQDNQSKLIALLEKTEAGSGTQYAVINKIAQNHLAVNDYESLSLFLTQWVEEHPDDPYNSYWLLMTAYSYLECNAEPIAEYYFERIINNYQDLMFQGQSIHFICYQHLINISKNPANKIAYFNQLISRFPNEVKSTELYYRLAIEYEKLGDWNLAIKSYKTFLEQDDASSIQISGYPNAYLTAKQLIDFNDSSKDWTFETRDELVNAVKKAIASYNWRELDKIKSKVNFFAMSWRQDVTDANAQEGFSMRAYMRGNRIRCNAELDASSSPREAFLRTEGWNNYVTVWYLYFRKVNFPADPEIHGRWEWAGIYYGEKL